MSIAFFNYIHIAYVIEMIIERIALCILKSKTSDEVLKPLASDA
jgi:hypothetical protein